jgi:uncharacterized protein (DUF58 family)
VLGATLAAALFGLDTRQTLAFQAFGLGAALLALAWLGSRRPPREVRARRQLPRHATVHQPVRYRVELENTGNRTLLGLTARETLADPRPSLQTFLQTRAPGEGRANPVDRLFAYPRWRWLLQRGGGADYPQPVALPALGPGAQTAIELQIVPRRRGFLRLEGLSLARSDPLGLGRAACDAASKERLLVLPQRYPLPLQRPPGRRRLQPGGVGLAAAAGDSREFKGLRGYRPGDSPRHIHWAAWARSGEPVVKEYQDEFFSRQALILDSFAPARQEPKFETAVSVAASFVEPLLGPDSLLDLMFVADRAYTYTGGPGLLSGQALLEVLACVAPAPPAEFPALARAVLGHAAALSACICVLLDWDPQRQALVHSLRVRDIPLKVLVVGGPGDPPPGPMADRPGDLHRLDPLRPERGLAAL